MPVIAMTQEMGSLAKDVALQLAQSQNLAVMRHEVIDHLAQKMEMPRSVIRRLREGKGSLVDRLTVDRESMALYTAQEMFELANRGNVVLRGWGATVLLRPVSHVVCVRITRSLKNRVEWLMEHLQTDDAEFVEAEIRRSDDAHAMRMHQQFGVTWGDPLLYDLVLNTDRVSIESCAEQIRNLIGRPEFQETVASRARLADMTLEARIRAALKDNAATRDIAITIEPSGGQVALRGIVLNAEERSNVEKVVSSTAGVTGVDSELRLMTMSKRFASAKIPSV
jgi:cytidylate kinase